ncbi:hypothetical protein SLA_5964 [Streptomyces laurentii]|uniref:DUF4034 domain-containing protein n=1 Tax=Streptomyces laurentii TaxID=39478 RepID=A0A160P7M3_STRLU|nr:hypothetical protein SLA_5964 [Streptomyces laurentii]
MINILLFVVLGGSLPVLYRLFLRPSRPDSWVFNPSAYGLPPRELLDSTRPGPPPPAQRTEERQAVAQAAWDGHWQSAARYIRAAGDDWDERWSRFEVLQYVAQEDDAWLDAWRAAEPGDCDAATLRASMMVHRAWKIRGSGYAHEVSASAMESFTSLLPAAIEEARRAALLDPANPGPWVVMITAARGAKYKRAQFRRLWDELVARAPYHYEAHWQALQYWCAKWFGNNRLMMRFARQAVRKAPPGSPLAGMYVIALAELGRRLPLVPPGTPLVRSRRLKRIAASFDQVAADDERLPPLRHLLAYFMVRSMSYGPAVEQFRLIGPWCDAQVWRGNGLAVPGFEAARRKAVKRSRIHPAPPAPQTHGMAR